MKYLISEEELNEPATYKVFYFYASWMIFSSKIIKMISSFEEKNNKYNFIAIDTDNYKNLCKAFNISSVPTFIIFVNGKEVKRFSGLILNSAFKSLLNDIYNKNKEEPNVKRK